jgi:hypothetical protein
MGSRRSTPSQFSRKACLRKKRGIYANPEWMNETISRYLYLKEVSKHFEIVHNAVSEVIRVGVSSMDEFTKSRHLELRGPRGRPFAKGNPGRKPGSKNKTTLIGQELLKEAEEDLLRKAIEMAKAGDAPMLKFLLDRILPKERSIQVELPKLLLASDAVDALGAIVEAIGTGQITPHEGASLATLVASYAQTIHVADLELRLDSLEKGLQLLRNGDGATF